MKPIILNDPWREQERQARIRRLKRITWFIAHAAFWVGLGLIIGRLAE